MTSRRDEILKEIGLAPVWRLRALDAGTDFSARREEHLQEEPPAALIADQLQGSHRGPALQGSAAPVTHRPSTPEDDRSAAIVRMDWTALRATVAQCVACPLHARRNKTVFGVGDENADWMFVGEGPGAEEDAQGEPFVGQAGRLLDNMLTAIKLKRGENVYIANIVKCRPPGNRNPEPAEARKCEPYLQRQIELIKPKLILALGRVAASNLLSREASIASLRGRVHDFKGTPLIVTYHPAYLLRNLTDKAKAWQDLCFAVKTMEGFKNH